MSMQAIQDLVKTAMKAGDTQRRDVLRVVLGDLQLQETRKGAGLSEDEVHAGVKKVIKGNREMIAAVEDAAVVERMQQEIAILEALLPRTLGVDEIVAALQPVRDDVVAAGNDGQATGVAMKHLKPRGLAVEGKDVASAVKQIRG
jgi:uncharacterized protein YqeY